MFGTILLSVTTVMHIYVLWRVASLSIIQKYLSRKFIFFLGSGIFIIYLVGRLYGRDGSESYRYLLEFFSMTWLGILFLLTLPLLTVDIVTGFGFFFSKLKDRLRTLAVCCGLILSAVALVQGMRAPIINHYTVHLPELSDHLNGTTVVALSDAHIGNMLGADWLNERISQVNEQKPDLILILGDFFEGHGYPQKDLLPILNRLTAPMGVWAVPGNHEFHGGDNKGLELFNNSGIQVLRNQWVEIQPGLILAGVDDYGASHQSSTESDSLSKALKNRPQGITILLSHAPRKVDEASAAGVDLMLSGHTHGGQIWPFSYLVQLNYKYLAGLYPIEKKLLIVSRGVGTWGPRMRLWHPSEFLHITLQKTS